MFNVSICDKDYYAPAGTPLYTVNLRDILELCFSKLVDDKCKGKHGYIFPYINNRLGREWWPNSTIFNDYVGFIDIDHLKKDIAQRIFDSFEELCKGFPYLLAINYSSSYFRRDDDVGLHLYINCGELNDREYYYWMRYLFGMLLFRIKKVLGIELEGEEIVDWHNCQITQRILLYYSPYKWNEDNIEFDPSEIVGLSEIKKKVEDKYREELRFGNSSNNENTEYEPSIEIENIELVNEDKNKVKVDRHLHIQGMSGNDIRWRICSISKKLFSTEEEAKYWCDRYFYYDNGKSIFIKGKDYGINSTVLNWLISNGYLKEKDIELYHHDEGYEVKTYLSEEYKDLIINKINEHKCLTIKGDTGLGKTVCISMINKEMKGIMLVPYLNMRQLYESQGIKIIERENQLDYNPEESCVMVYDRYSLMNDSQVQGKTVFIDESHVLFTDRTFRKRLIEVIEKLKRCAGKIVIISATPLYESEILQSEETLVFTKARRYVDLYWKDSSSINECKVLVDAIISENMKNGKYDLICLFSNRCVRYVYDNLLVRYGRSIHNVVNVFHRDYEDLGDIERIMKTEVLDKKINIGTSLIYNGLNFNNVENNVLVVIEWDKYHTHGADLVQCIGRFRKCGINVYIVGVDYEIEDYESNKLNSQILTKLHLDHKLFSYNEDYVNISEVVDELYNFKSNECIKETTIEYLKSYGYIRVHEIEDSIDEEIGPRKNMLKERIDMIVKKELKGEKLTFKEEELKKNGMKYYTSEMKHINDYLWKYSLTKENLLELNDSQMIKSDNSVKYVSLFGTISYLNKIILSSIDDMNYWNNVEDELKKEWKEINNEKIIKKQGSELKKVKDLNTKYNKFFSDYEHNDNMKDCVSSLINTLIKENKDKNEEKSKKRSNASKRKSKKVVVTDKMPGWMINKYRLSYNKSFDSSNDMALYCNISKGLITKWIKLLYVNKLD